MNKIKVLYDVVKIMKKKEIINGAANLEVINDETKVVSLSNEFTRNTVSGEIKAKISKEINIDGAKVKEETNAEFNIKHCPIHKFHHGAHMAHGNKISKMLFMLNVLNNLKAEEKGEKTILSLDLNEVLKEGKELRAEFNEKNRRYVDEGGGPHNHHEFIKRFLSAEYKDAILVVTVNKTNEIDKIEVSANGENIINGFVNFIW